MTLRCPYCHAKARLVDARCVYRDIRPRYEKVWICANYPRCDSYVGTHPGTGRPLGTLASPELRRWRHAAHLAFDAQWIGVKLDQKRRREKAYVRLAKVLGMTKEQCHIGLFDVEMCQLIVKLYASEGVKG